MEIIDGWLVEWSFVALSPFRDMLEIIEDILKMNKTLNGKYLKM